jgi:hypothetical protein
MKKKEIYKLLIPEVKVIKNKKFWEELIACFP